MVQGMTVGAFEPDEALRVAVQIAGKSSRALVINSAALPAILHSRSPRHLTRIGEGEQEHAVVAAGVAGQIGHVQPGLGGAGDDQRAGLDGHVLTAERVSVVQRGLNCRSRDAGLGELERGADAGGVAGLGGVVLHARQAVGIGVVGTSLSPSSLSFSSA